MAESTEELLLAARSYLTSKRRRDSEPGQLVARLADRLGSADALDVLAAADIEAALADAELGKEGAARKAAVILLAQHTVSRSLAGRVVAALMEERERLHFGNLTTCGNAHLARERALRIIERHGWPSAELSCCETPLGWLDRATDGAGPVLNRAAQEAQRLQDEVPF